MKKAFVSLIMLILGTTVIYAQFDAQFSQYWACASYYNAANAGESGGGRALIINRQQWVGMPGAPKTLFAQADLPVSRWGKEHGIGLNLLSDNIGLFSNSTISLNYAYKTNLWGGHLSVGTQLGIVNQSFDGSQVNIKDFTSAGYETGDDAIPSSSVQAMVFDMGLGIWYSKADFYTGLSVAHLTEPTIDFDENSSVYIGKVVYLTSGYKVNLENPDWTLYPTMLIKSDFKASQIEATLRGEYKQRLWGGLSYRYKDAFVFLVGIHKSKLSAGYAYDLSTTKIFNVSKGSHELFVAYKFDFRLKKNSKRKITRSLRYL